LADTDFDTDILNHGKLLVIPKNALILSYEDGFWTWSSLITSQLQELQFHALGVHELLL